MIITKLCIILLIFAKHCDSLSTCRQLLYFTTAGHATYLLCLSLRRGDSSHWSLAGPGPPSHPPAPACSVIVLSSKYKKQKSIK